jgi:mRNA interferase RelE/StbE
MYKVVYAKRAAKALQKTPKDVIRRIRRGLERIAADPFARHPNVTRLRSRPGYRLRVGDWRVIYEIEQDKLVILVLGIGPRGEMYR